MSREHDPSENELTAAERSTERALAALTPAAPRIDRDRLMFLAGQASASPAHPVAVRPLRLAWPAATAALAATSLALAMALFARPALQQQIVYRDRIISVAAPSVAAAPVADPPVEVRPAIARSAPAVPAHDNYLHTREVALRLGLDALGRPPSGGDREGASTYGDWLGSLFPPAAAGSKLDQFPQM